MEDPARLEQFLKLVGDKEDDIFSERAADEADFRNRRRRNNQVPCGRVRSRGVVVRDVSVFSNWNGDVDLVQGGPALEPRECPGSSETLWQFSACFLHRRGYRPKRVPASVDWCGENRFGGDRFEWRRPLLSNPRSSIDSASGKCFLLSPEDALAALMGGCPRMKDAFGCYGEMLPCLSLPSPVHYPDDGPAISWFREYCNYRRL